MAPENRTYKSVSAGSFPALDSACMTVARVRPCGPIGIPWANWDPNPLIGHRHPAVTLDYLGLTDDDVREGSERIDL